MYFLLLAQHMEAPQGDDNLEIPEPYANIVMDTTVPVPVDVLRRELWGRADSSSMKAHLEEKLLKDIVIGEWKSAGGAGGGVGGEGGGREEKEEKEETGMKHYPRHKKAKKKAWIEHYPLDPSHRTMKVSRVLW
jgi:hypothetical protein